MLDPLEWPARAYIYGTFGYALSEATNRAKRFRIKMYLYAGEFDGERAWVVSWDPKRR